MIRFLRWSLFAVMAVAAAILAYGVLFAGGFPVSGKAVVNIESLIAVAAIAQVLLRAAPARLGNLEGSSLVPESLGFAAVALSLALLLFHGILHNGFLFDDYTILRNAGAANARTIIAEFGPVHGRGLFYRPVASLAYWIDLHWASLDSLRWHLLSIFAHALDSFLVFLLLRQLDLRRAAAISGGVFFVAYAASAETVAWVSARYDLTCTFFVLVSLLAMLAYSRKPHWIRLTVALLACTLACCTKESAFSVPLLAGALAIGCEMGRRRNMFRAAFHSLVLCVVLFAYRWWAIGGIGGYTADGSPTFLQFNALRAADALLFRAWGVLLFPVNWSAHLTPIEAGALVSYLGALVAVCSLRASRDLVVCAILFIGAALLPVYQMILISTDLAGAREFYTPSIGLAILVAALVPAGRTKVALPALGAVLLFHAVMLEHNLRFWGETTRVASNVCREMATVTVSSDARILTPGLPTKRNGVPFLANGFPECVAFFTPGGMERRPEIVVVDEPGWTGRVFTWDPAKERMVEMAH